MTRKEQINLLKQYRNYLLFIKKEMELEQINNQKDKPKVLVLKKQFNGRDINVA